MGSTSKLYLQITILINCMTQEDLSVYSPIDNGGLIAGGTVFLLRFLPFLGGWRGYSLGQYLVLIT